MLYLRFRGLRGKAFEDFRPKEFQGFSDLACVLGGFARRPGMLQDLACASRWCQEEQTRPLLLHLFLTPNY